MKFPLVKYPSAVIPMAMSLVALALVLAHVAIFGVVQGIDEGTATHVFQILLVAQLPFVVFFAVKWLPRKPRQALWVLTLQAAAALAAMAAAFYLT